jgi:hypothetical protein
MWSIGQLSTERGQRLAFDLRLPTRPSIAEAQAQLTNRDGNRLRCIPQHRFGKPAILCFRELAQRESNQIGRPATRS